jgi:hypothetical protein
MIYSSAHLLEFLLEWRLDGRRGEQIAQAILSSPGWERLVMEAVEEQGAELYVLLERLVHLERAAIKQQRVLRWLMRRPLQRYDYQDSELLGGLLLLREDLPRSVRRSLEIMGRIESQAFVEKGLDTSTVLSFSRLRDRAVRRSALWLLDVRQAPEAADRFSEVALADDVVGRWLALQSLSWRDDPDAWGTLETALRDVGQDRFRAQIALRAAAVRDHERARLLAAEAAAPRPPGPRSLDEVYMRHLYSEIGEADYADDRIRLIQGAWLH